MKMYEELAEWWILLSPPEEYAEEAAEYDRLIRATLEGEQRTMLELGSGGGHNASHLKGTWDLTLVDRSEPMLAQSRKLNPALVHLLGDMRDVRLGEIFDAVFIHDAICHLTSVEDLRRALTTAFVHTRPGGVVLVAPDDTLENFHPETESGGHDGAERAMRYFSWTHPPDEAGLVAVDYALMLRDAEGAVRVVHDRHLHGLFPRQTWIDALEGVGFVDVVGIDAEHSELEPGSYEIFRGVRRT